VVNRRRDVFRFRVDLLGIEPPIWREILVPAWYSFWDLHVAIQDAMGWLDCHLHEFHVETGDVDAQDMVFGLPMDDGCDLPYAVLPGWEFSIVDFVFEPGAVMRYEYDFGDSWIHSVKLLDVEVREKGKKYPQCTAGARACPPEDCGGLPGYEELLRIIFAPPDSDYEAMNEWIPHGWGPEIFNVSSVKFDNPKRRWRMALGE
jgi:hypothetical protein